MDATLKRRERLEQTLPMPADAERLALAKGIPNWMDAFFDKSVLMAIILLLNVFAVISWIDGNRTAAEPGDAFLGCLCFLRSMRRALLCVLNYDN
jgi:hypothetical protein